MRYRIGDTIELDGEDATVMDRDDHGYYVAIGEQTEYVSAWEIEPEYEA